MTRRSRPSRSHGYSRGLFNLDATGQLKPGLAARVERLSVSGSVWNCAGTPRSAMAVPSQERGRHPLVASRRSSSDSIGGGLIVAPPDSRLPVDALLLEARIFSSVTGQVRWERAVCGRFPDGHGTTAQPAGFRRPAASMTWRVIAYPDTRHAFAHTLKGDANLIVDLESKWLEFFRGVPSLQVIHGAAEARTPSPSQRVASQRTSSAREGPRVAARARARVRHRRVRGEQRDV